MRESSPPVLATALVVDTRGRMLVLSMPRPTGGAVACLPSVQASGAHAPEAELADTLYGQFGVHPHHLKRLLAVDCEQLSPVLTLVSHVHLVGPLDEHQVRAVKTPPLLTVRWLAPEAVIQLLPALAASRLRAAVAAWHTGSIAHLVGGRVQLGSPAGFTPAQRAHLEDTRALDPDLHQAMRPKVLAEVNVLLTDPAGHALLLHPASGYDPTWHLPGDGIGSDMGEGPREAARRVLRGQLHLDLPVGRLLAVDWINGTPQLSRMAYTFHGTTLGEHDLARIRLNPHQHTEWRMASADDSKTLVHEPLHQRLDACLTTLWNNTGPVELRSGIPRS
ncbi:NUDIX domain-containing protein [Streptomyces sp. ERV7]|uniref:NUDIX domain-containing protein n=1 Tax=Streptomyces sp. ERV7 TaxID=1322334 RepID=UPI00131DDAD7|nr:NUDIX domain-containing protein [Streptomyces sp. ERV7]